ncbi:MAG: hypothetical protein ACP5IH_05885 [Desulfurella sp.]|uniref:hypothetical protein n=1 Tax=Desulfurella sp. TaxID=1962857 RepID=UPI003D10FE14
MQIENILEEFLNGNIKNFEQLVNELSLYIAKVFYKTGLFSEINELKSEITIFLYQKKESFLKYNQNLRWLIVKTSAINYFKDILKQKKIQLIETEEKDLLEILDNKPKQHTQYEYIEKIEALDKLKTFQKLLSDKESLILLDILGCIKYVYTSKQAEYKAKERLKKKLKDIIIDLNLDYETTDLIFDLLCAKSKNAQKIVNKAEGKI